MGREKQELSTNLILQRFFMLSDDILVYVQAGDGLCGIAKGWVQNEVARVLSGCYHPVSA